MKVVCGIKCVLQQAGHRHGADSSRYGGDPAGIFGSAFEFYVATKFTVFEPINANVNYGCARFDP